MYSFYNGVTSQVYFNVLYERDMFLYLWYNHLDPVLQCLLKLKVDLNFRTFLNFTKNALQSFSLS